MAASVAHSVLEQVFDSFAACITPKVAQRIEEIQLDPRAQDRIDELTEKANTGTLTAEERAQYEDFIEAIDFLAIFQAKARLALSRKSA